MVQIIDLILYFISYIIVIYVGMITIDKILIHFPLKDKTDGIKGAGAAIGILERSLTLTFVFLGQYAAIAIVLTAKSIARFDELKKQDFAEYYLIGTLSSILFSIIVGLVTEWMIIATG